MNTTLKVKITVPASAGASTIATAPARNGGSTDPREFLAMRARQKQAQARARHWRLSFLALVGAGMIVAGIGLPRWRHHAQAATAPVAASSPAVGTPLEAVPLEAPIVTAPSETTDESPATVAPAAAVESAIAARCQDDFGRRQWRAAIDSCAQAFAAAPEAGVAMKLAHSYWSHGDAERAGHWATRALALGSDDADAYVLVGHAEREAGDSTAAITAYRKYLHLAPYGWHASRVRAAIRALKAAAPAEEASASN